MNSSVGGAGVVREVAMVTVHIVQALCDGGEGGNPAGVVLLEEPLAPQVMQFVAAKVGLSETAFVSLVDPQTAHLSFFTPKSQIPDCGHATIAAYHTMRELGLIANGIFHKKTIAATSNVVVDDTRILMQYKSPVMSHLMCDDSLVSRLALCFGCTTAGWVDLAAEQGVWIGDTGNRFLLVSFSSLDDLARIRPDMSAIESLSEELNLIGFYPFTLKTFIPGRQASARMFAPRFGIPEESGTGTAAGPLGCLLYNQGYCKSAGIVIEQGRLMTPPSPCIIRLEIQLEKGKVTGLLGGGEARLVSRIFIDL